jgi:uncharacterized protein (TIGR00251 family)
MLNIQERDGVVVVAVRVQPRSSRDEVVGESDGALKVRLQAPAVENRANEALCEYLAELLKTPNRLLEFLTVIAAGRSVSRFAESRSNNCLLC